MPLPDFLKRHDEPSGAQGRSPKRAKKAAPAANKLTVDPAGAAALRAQVQRRLMGVAVLLILGVVLFSFVLDRQPRPSLADVPLSSASVEKPASLDDAPRKAQGTVAQAAVPEAPAAVSTLPDKVPPAAEVAQVVPTEGTQVSSKATLESESAPETKKEPKVEPEAKAALRGEAKGDMAKEAAPAEGRFVVQVGAYTDPVKLRDVRAKLSGMGLQNYTQVIKNAEGERTRVRIGPFGKREEAQKVIERVKAAGLPTALLSL